MAKKKEEKTQMLILKFVTDKVDIWAREPENIGVDNEQLCRQEAVEYLLLTHPDIMKPPKQP